MKYRRLWFLIKHFPNIMNSKKVKVMVKQSPYISGQAQRVPGSYGSQIS